MSSLRDDNMDPSNPLYYAPRRARYGDDVASDGSAAAVTAFPDRNRIRESDKANDPDKFQRAEKFQRPEITSEQAGRQASARTPERAERRDAEPFREPAITALRSPQPRAAEPDPRSLEFAQKTFQHNFASDSFQSEEFQPQDFPPHNLDSRLRQLADEKPLPRRSATENVAPRRATEEPPRPRSKIFEDAVSRALKESLEPAEQVYAPPLMSRRARHGAFGQVGRFVAAIAVAALIALFFILVVPMMRKPADTDVTQGSTSVWGQIKDALLSSPPRKTASTLLVADQSGAVNEPLELGVTITAPTVGTSVIISGLPVGSRLTAGKKVGASEWRIPAQEVATASVIPPSDYVGQANLSAELRTAEGAALVGGTFRMTWTGPAGLTSPAARPPTIPQMYPSPVIAPQAAAPVAVPQVAVPVIATAPSQAAASAVGAQAVRNIDPSVVAGMIKRAQELAASGDFLPARLLLERAAEARSARAASILAETYDPIALRQFANGPAPDVNMARNWYRKAKEWGAPDAQRQLDALQAY